MRIFILSFARSFPVIIFVHLFTFASLVSYAQDLAKDNEIEDLIYKTDSILGSNDELYNGVIYYQGNWGSKGHPFYNNSEWQTSTLIVNGEIHHQQLVKYNIESNELIALLAQKSGATYPVVLNSDFVDEFHLNNHHFVNIKYLNINDEKMDFLEKVYEGSFSFYTSYNKEFLKVFNDKSPQGKYSSASSNYYLFDNRGIQNLASVKSLIKYLDIDKKELKSFLREHNIKYKKANVFELKIILQHCDYLITLQ